MTKLIDVLPILPLALMAILLGLAPFAQEPHLVEKIRWLFNGTPFKMIDWFDLMLYGTPVLLLIWKLVRVIQLRRL